MLGDHPMSAQQKPDDACPLKLRRGIPEVAQARDAKKARMRSNGVPERYLHLVDKEECVWCIESAPDAVHVTVVWKDEFAPRFMDGRIDKVTEVKLTAQIERQLRDDLAGGRVESFYVWLSYQRCRCCPEDPDQKPEDDDGWDGDLGLNTDFADAFDDPQDLPPLPDDLKNAPSGWVPPPPLENFPKPRRRYMHVTCVACQGLADQWNDAAGTLDYLWDRKISLQRQINVTLNAIGNRRNEINDLEYQQRFNTSRSYDRMKQIENLRQVNDGQQSDVDREERQLAEVEKEIAAQQARMDAIMQKVMECEKACKKTTDAPAATATTASGPTFTDPAPPPANVAARPAPQAPSTPVTNAAPVPGVCDACQLAAQDVARLQKAIADRTAELQRLRDTISVNASSLANLYQLRRDADRSGPAGRADELSGRITELQATQASLRDQVFDVQQQITRLNEDFARAVRTLDECLKKCGQDITAMPEYSRLMTGTDPRNGRAQFQNVTVGPLAVGVVCDLCKEALTQLESAHRELQRLAQRANARGTQQDVDAFEDQRQRVADLQAALARCVAEKCKGGTTNNTTGDLNTTGTTPLQVPKVCEKCQQAAIDVATLERDIATRNQERTRLLERQGENAANLGNLSTLIASATGRDEARAIELDRRMRDLQAAQADLRTQIQAVDEAIAQLNERLADAVRALEACLRTCGQTMVAMPEYRHLGDIPGAETRAKLTLTVSPLLEIPACEACAQAASDLRNAHQELQRIAQRANDLGLGEDFAAFEEQRAIVARLQAELTRCIAEKCKQQTTTNNTANTTGNAPVTTPTPPTPMTPATSTPTPSTAPDPAPMTPAECPCDKRPAQIKELEARQQQARAEFNEAANANAALGKQLLADEAAFRDAVRDGKTAEADRLRARMNDIVAERGPLQAASDKAYGQMQDLGKTIDWMRGDLEACRRRCGTTTSTTATNTTGGIGTSPTTPVGAMPATPISTTSTGPAIEIDKDCTVPGTPCSYAYTPRIGTDWPKLNLNDPIAWGNVLTVTIELRVQRKGSDVLDPATLQQFAQPLAPINATKPQPDQQPPPEVVIPPAEGQKVEAWFNPLGLIARRLVDHVERWRGSVGPRPLITRRDLALVDSVSSTQSLGLPKGLHFLMVDQGGSTGKTITMQILNLTGTPVRLQAMPFVMEPLQRQAQEQVQKAFSKLSKLAPVRLDLSAYCTEFLKLPPTPNTIMRLAPPEIQKQFEPMSKVLRSAYRIKNAGLLHPDSNPAAYTDSIKQWALWTVEQKLNESRYTDAFIGHTKKNMEGAGQKWSKPAEDVIRQVAPNRWRDIAQILRGAGVPIPQ